MQKVENIKDWEGYRAIFAVCYEDGTAFHIGRAGDLAKTLNFFSHPKSQYRISQIIRDTPGVYVGVLYGEKNDNSDEQKSRFKFYSYHYKGEYWRTEIRRSLNVPDGRYRYNPKYYLPKPNNDGHTMDLLHSGVIHKTLVAAAGAGIKGEDYKKLGAVLCEVFPFDANALYAEKEEVE